MVFGERTKMLIAWKWKLELYVEIMCMEGEYKIGWKSLENEDFFGGWMSGKGSQIR